MYEYYNIKMYVRFFVDKIISQIHSVENMISAKTFSKKRTSQLAFENIFSAFCILI